MNRCLKSKMFKYLILFQIVRDLDEESCAPRWLEDSLAQPSNSSTYNFSASYIVTKTVLYRTRDFSQFFKLFLCKLFSQYLTFPSVRSSMIRLSLYQASSDVLSHRNKHEHLFYGNICCYAILKLSSLDKIELELDFWLWFLVGGLLTVTYLCSLYHWWGVFLKGVTECFSPETLLI